MSTSRHALRAIRLAIVALSAWTCIFSGGALAEESAKRFSFPEKGIGGAGG